MCYNLDTMKKTIIFMLVGIAVAVGFGVSSANALNAVTVVSPNEGAAAGTKGSCNWQVGETLQGNEGFARYYKIQICEDNTASCDSSDKPFTIVTTPSSIPNATYGTLLGRVVKDDNYNGFLDRNESYLLGVKSSSCTKAYYSDQHVISYSGPVSGTVKIDKCNPAPYYSINLPVGRYRVSVIPNPAYWASSDNLGGVEVEITKNTKTHKWFYLPADELKKPRSPPGISLSVLIGAIGGIKGEGGGGTVGNQSPIGWL